MSAKPTLLQLLDALQDPLSAEWYTLGLRLGYDAGKLNIIRENNHHVVEHCMRDLLTLWLQKYPKKGWGDIADALREMDKNDVADKIARQYNLPSPAAETFNSDTRKALTHLVTIVLQGYCATLNSYLKQNTLSSFANKMYSAGLINADVRDSPAYNRIEKEFVTLLGLYEQKQDFERDCKEFLHALKSHGRPLEILSNKIEKEWRERASKELGITLRLS